MLKQTIIKMRAEETSHDKIKDPKFIKLVNQLCTIEKNMKKLVPSTNKEQFYNLSIKYETVYAKMTRSRPSKEVNKIFLMVLR